MATSPKWAIAFGALMALWIVWIAWIAVANAAPAQFYVVEWIIRVTPQTNFEDCTRMAEDRAKRHTAACLTAEQYEALKVKKQ